MGITAMVPKNIQQTEVSTNDECKRIVTKKFMAGKTLVLLCIKKLKLKASHPTIPTQ